MVIFAGLVVLSIFAPWLTSQQPTKIVMGSVLSEPTWSIGGETAHPLGTDGLGRDVLSRLLYGGRVSLLVGLASVAISGSLGITLGILAGYIGGLVGEVIMRLADIQLAFPTFLLAISIMSVLGPGLLNVIIVIGISNWVAYARIARSEVVALREQPFVEAARCLGATSARIIWRHLLPNTLPPLIVIATFSVSGAMISEAVLSFLGLGVGVSTPTWGAMLADGREYMFTAWWLVMFPGLAISLAVMSVNIVGDWLRDRLDPTLRLER